VCFGLLRTKADMQRRGGIAPAYPADRDAASRAAGYGFAYPALHAAKAGKPSLTISATAVV